MIVALPAAATGALSGGEAQPVRAAANSTTYQDSTGETPNAPDITTIVVSNDDAGMLSFRINVPNRPTLAQDLLVDLYVNTDDNVNTGSPDLAGVDYVIQLVRGEVNLYRWDGTDHPALRRSLRGDPHVLVPGRRHDPDLGGGARQHQAPAVLHARRERDRGRPGDG